MKKYIYILTIIALCLSTSCKDDDDKKGKGKAKNVTVVDAKIITGDIYAINITEGTSIQLETYVTPFEAREQPVSFHFAGEPTGAISLTDSGLLTALATTASTGEIPEPIATDTIRVTVDDGSGTYVRYPVRVISAIKIITSITIQSDGQKPSVVKDGTFDLTPYITINPNDATNRTLIFTSEDESVATVDQNGIITGHGDIGATTNILITANDRGKQQTSAFVTIAGEAPLYLPILNTEKFKLSSNLGTKEGVLENLLDGSNSSFWAPEILKRPIYSPDCWLDIDMGEVVKFGQLGYRHRGFNHPHLQLHSFKLEGKKEGTDEWIDLGTFVTIPKQITDFQLFPIETPQDLRYLRINFIKGHLRDGKNDWDYEENGNVSVGDVQFYIHNR